MPENETRKLKTKLCNRCKKYCHIKVTYKQKKIISSLSNRKDIVQKGRGVLTMDQNTYTEKRMPLFLSNQFVHIANDTTKSLESKVQGTIQKIKSELSEQEMWKKVYKKLHPTGSCPGKFYGTGQVHNFPVNSGIIDLPIQPIVWCLNTATYNIAKYLSKLLSPLQQSGNTVENKKEFIEDLKQQHHKNMKMVSFDGKSLFTNVPLDHTIDKTLRRINNKKGTVTSKNEMEMLLCMKNVHFTFESKTYVQTDDVAMGSPLG